MNQNANEAGKLPLCHFEIELSKGQVLSGRAAFDAATRRLSVPQDVEDRIAREWNTPVTGAFVAIAGRKKVLLSTADGWIADADLGVFDGNRNLEQSPGQIAYERDLAAQPSYDGGARRKGWNQLCDVAKASWERNPTDRKMPDAHVAPDRDPNVEFTGKRKLPEVQRDVVEVSLAGDGLATSGDAMATLDLATGIVSGVEPIRWHDDDDDSEASIVICRKTVVVTRDGNGQYSVRPDLLAALKEAVLEDLSAGLKVRLGNGWIQDGFIVWEGGTDVARCNDLERATRVAQALRLAGSLENIWVTKGSEFENVFDDSKPQSQSPSFSV